MSDVIPAPVPVRVPVRGGGSFPVRRVYCVGRNFADHAREMGAQAPASKAERGTPVFFMKPGDAVTTSGTVHYPPATADLHHEVELVVALGRDTDTLYGCGASLSSYGVGSMTRRDLQPAGKHRLMGHRPGLRRIGAASELARRRYRFCAPLACPVAVTARKPAAPLSDLIWDVPESCTSCRSSTHSRGRPVFMGTPAAFAACRGDNLRMPPFPCHRVRSSRRRRV